MYIILYSWSTLIHENRLERVAADDDDDAREYRPNYRSHVIKFAVRVSCTSGLVARSAAVLDTCSVDPRAYI